MCVWVCGKFDQPEILGKGLSEQVTIELTPKDPQKDYLKQRKQQVQKPEKGKIFPKTPQFIVMLIFLKKWLQKGWFEWRQNMPSEAERDWLAMDQALSVLPPGTC